MKLYYKSNAPRWGAIKIGFRKKLGIWPTKGGGEGLTEAQVFVEIFQNQI